MAGFVHLHLHTEYSLLDGECLISALPGAVKRAGQNAVAITDHGVLYGIVDFFKACAAEGVKPIIGCEVYLAPRGMNDKTYPADSDYTHLTLLVKDARGYENLMKIVSLSFTEGFYQKPRTDKETLKKYSDGLIALSGCISGLIPKCILRGDFPAARENALWFAETFGKDNFYLELQRHGIEEQNTVNTFLITLSRECKVPLAATNDVHYTERADSTLQKLLMAIQTGNTVDDPGFGMRGSEHYLKSSAEMSALFADLPEAIENTVKIAERCNFTFDFGSTHLPAFTPPSAYNPQQYLQKLCRDGYAEKGASGAVKECEEYKSRMEYELSVITGMGFTDYYLIVWDFVAFAKKRSIPVGPGRGSGVGSLCAYFLGITDVDPIKNGLLFERFLNPERVSMPDFDIDFCDERRGEVIDYVSDKYGRDHVAQIITFGTLACRQAVRDAGRALGMPYAAVDAAAKLIPRYLGVTVESALRESKELKSLWERDEQIKRLLGFARALEGRPRNASTHATGVVITDKPITNYVPLALNDSVVVTQFPMNTVAELGLLKIDFLGLRFLTVLDDSEKYIKKHTPFFSLEKVGFTDEATYAMLAAGQSAGLFQLESDGMRSLLMRMKPFEFEDIVSAISLYRPGPMQSIDKFLENRKNPEKTDYILPQLKEVLSPTHGCIIYQEQVMQIFRILAGYSYGRADIVRRAMSKKKAEEMEKERAGFIEGCADHGVPAEKAEEIFGLVNEFAKYAFNKSHAAAYAVVAYRTAYLKCHFPREYMCALLKSVSQDTGKVKEYIDDCARMGIKVLPPDINESGEEFAVSGAGIRFGLVAIKNVGRLFAKKLIAERETNGRFASYEDFLTRTHSFGSARMTESLILCGALDGFGIYRSRLISALDSALEILARQRNTEYEGQIGLFDSDESGSTFLSLDFAQINEYPLLERLTREKELTGLYFTGHPLDKYGDFIKKTGALTSAQLLKGLQNGIIKDKQLVKFLGLVQKKRPKVTKNNSVMAFLAAEDSDGDAEVIMFPAVYESQGGKITEGGIYLFECEATLREAFGNEASDELKLLMRSVSEPGEPEAIPDSRQNGPAAPDLYLKITSANSAGLTAALEFAKEKPGASRVLVYFDKEKKLRAAKDVTCTADNALIRKLSALLGAGNVAVKEPKNDKQP